MRRRPYQPNAPGQPLSADPAPEEDLLQSRTVTLTSAQILALKDTPVLIVPAPGANKTIVPVLITASMHPGAIPYTLVIGTELQFTWDDGTPGAIFIAQFAAAGLLDTLVPNFAAEDPFINEVDPTAGSRNLPLNLRVSPATGNPTLGDGTLEITVFFVHAPT